MIRQARAPALMFLLAAVAAGPAHAAEDPALLKDLTSVIALLGVPCGKVVSATRIADNDHIAVCSSGDRYHVYVNKEGRVVAERKK